MNLKVKLLLLFLLILVLSHHVDSCSIVKFLPGFEGPLPFELETGYIGIGEDEEVQLFYYFIKSENNPKEDPLLLWLDGGPGCSSIFGLFFENGPLALKFEVYNGSLPSLVSTTFSWTKMANILYLEQPVGTGFSYSKTPLNYKPNDTGEVKRIHEFTQKWLSKHPQFFSNPFYVGGGSYSGMVIPALVQEISKGNYICCKPPINLQGYILGNPLTHIEVEQNYRIPFAHGMALISDELYESMKRICKGNYGNVDPLNIECLKLNEIYGKVTTGLYINHILLPDCDTSSPDCFKTSDLQQLIKAINLESHSKELHGILTTSLVYLYCLKKLPSFMFQGKPIHWPTLLQKLYRYFLLGKWANEESVRKALHVTKGSIGEWVRCNEKANRYNFDIKSSVPYLMNNSINGYRSLIFSGDHDMVVPFIATQAWIRSLNYSIIDDWRPWMINNQIAGYTRTYSNKMTFATIKGGGHTAEYKPNETFIMFQRWISSQPL